MIIRENNLRVDDFIQEYILEPSSGVYKPEELIFFDLEHYVYKKPKCIGVFGAAVYDKNTKKLNVTQYMIENRYESADILILAEKYFKRMKESGKRAIVTFSGNNDFTVINYLFEKFKIKYDFKTEFDSVDLQKEYEKEKSKSIGLKNLEKIFGIIREGELISGSNLAKTFHKVMKDTDYIQRMPREKIEKILLYNEQDVVNLYHIYAHWKQYIFKEYEEEENEEELELQEETEIQEEKIEEKEEIKEELEKNLEDVIEEDITETIQG